MPVQLSRFPLLVETNLDWGNPQRGGAVPGLAEGSSSLRAPLVYMVGYLVGSPHWLFILLT